MIYILIKQNFDSRPLSADIRSQALLRRLLKSDFHLKMVTRTTKYQVYCVQSGCYARQSEINAATKEVPTAYVSLQHIRQVLFSGKYLKYNINIIPREVKVYSFELVGLSVRPSVRHALFFDFVRLQTQRLRNPQPRNLYHMKAGGLDCVIGGPFFPAPPQNFGVIGL